MMCYLIDHIFFQRPTKISWQDPDPDSDPESGSGFVNQDYGSADPNPDPKEIFIDPQ
jgi:hypothetical protein